MRVSASGVRNSPPMSHLTAWYLKQKRCWVNVSTKALALLNCYVSEAVWDNPEIPSMLIFKGV